MPEYMRILAVVVTSLRPVGEGTSAGQVPAGTELEVGGLLVVDEGLEGAGAEVDDEDPPPQPAVTNATKIAPTNTMGLTLSELTDLIM